MRVKRQVKIIPNVPRSWGSGLQGTYDSVSFAAVVLAWAKGIKSRTSPNIAILNMPDRRLVKRLGVISERL